MTPLAELLAALSAEASLPAAVVRFEPVNDPHDEEYQLRGNRDGLLLLAHSLIVAAQSAGRHVSTVQYFPRSPADEQYVFRVVCDPNLI